MEKLNDRVAPAAIVKEGEGCGVTPSGKPENVTITEPLNPANDLTEMEIRPLEFPRVESSWAGEMETEKSPTDGVGGV